MLSHADQIAQLEYVVREQMAEIDQLRVEIVALVDWIAGEKDALSALQAAYVDPRSTPTNKIRAAASAIAYERSKPAQVVVQVDFKQRVYEARMKQMAKDKARWAAEDAAKVIEHQPLDLESPTPPTILGEAKGSDPAA